MASLELGEQKASFELNRTTRPLLVAKVSSEKRSSVERGDSPVDPFFDADHARLSDQYLTRRSHYSGQLHGPFNEALGPPGPSRRSTPVPSKPVRPTLERMRTHSFELGKGPPELQVDLELGEHALVSELASYPPRQSLRFAPNSTTSKSRLNCGSWFHQLATAPLALFQENQRHNLWLTMSIIGRVLYGFGPVLIVQRFQQIQQPMNSPSPGFGGGPGQGPGGPGGGQPPYTPLGIAWPAALSVIGAGFGFAASLGNWNDGKKINRKIAYRNWAMHNAGIILQLAGHFITPLAQDRLEGSQKLVAFFPQAISAGCLWMTIPASYAASASTRTLTISEGAVARRLELCNWVRATGGLFMTIWFASYVVNMHPLAVETFNIVGVLSVLLSFSMLMIPLRVITAKPRTQVSETADERAWNDMIWRGGFGLQATHVMTPGGHLISREDPQAFAEAIEMSREGTIDPPAAGSAPLVRTMTI